MADLRSEARAAAARNGVDPDLFERLINQESRFNPEAVNPESGATGLGQLMPATAAELRVNPKDPIQNLDGAARYLKQQIDEFGDVPRAVAAYNAGPDNVRKYNGIPPFEETKDYVLKVAGDGRTVQDLGRLARRKDRRGVYADLSDIEIGRRLRAKYPAYSIFADLPDTVAAPESTVQVQAPAPAAPPAGAPVPLSPEAAQRATPESAPFQAPQAPSEAQPSPEDLAFEKARYEALPAAQRAILQFSGAAGRALPGLGETASRNRFPEPTGPLERGAALAGGVAGFSAVAVPVALATEGLGAGPLLAGAIGAGAAGAAPPGTAKERLARGGTMALTSAGAGLVGRSVAAAVSKSLATEAPALAAALQQEYRAALRAGVAPEIARQRIQAKIAQASAAAVARARAIQTGAGAVTSAAAFGAAQPVAQHAALSAMGEKSQAPQPSDMVQSGLELLALNIVLGARGLAKGAASRGVSVGEEPAAVERRAAPARPPEVPAPKPVPPVVEKPIEEPPVVEAPKPIPVPAPEAAPVAEAGPGEQPPSERPPTSAEEAPVPVPPEEVVPPGNPPPSEGTSSEPSGAKEAPVPVPPKGPKRASGVFERGDRVVAKSGFRSGDSGFVLDVRGPEGQRNVVVRWDNGRTVSEVPKNLRVRHGSVKATEEEVSRLESVQEPTIPRSYKPGEEPPPRPDVEGEVARAVRRRAGFRPLEEMPSKPSQGFRKGSGEDTWSNEKFVTDGHVLYMTEAIDPKVRQQIHDSATNKTLEGAPNVDAVIKEATAGAQVKLESKGWATLPGFAAHEKESDVAVFHDPATGRVVALDPQKWKLAVRAVSPDSYSQPEGKPHGPVVLKRKGKFVGLVMPMRTNDAQLEEIRALIGAPPSATAKVKSTASSIYSAKTGEPVEGVVFHGSGRAEKGSVYGRKEIAEVGGVASPAKYWALDKETAARFGPKIEEKSIRLERPLVIASDVAWRDFTKTAGIPPFPGIEEALFKSPDRVAWLKDWNRKLRAHALKSGHDGMVIKLTSRAQGDQTRRLGELFGDSQVIDFEVAPKETVHEARVGGGAGPRTVRLRGGGVVPPAHRGVPIATKAPRIPTEAEAKTLPRTAVPPTPPSLKETPIDKVKDAFRELVAITNPVRFAVGPNLDLMMKSKGTLKRALFRTEQSQKSLTRFWERRSKEQVLDFLKRYEAGAEPDPRLAKIADSYRKRTDNMFKAIARYKDIPYWENWFPHAWKNQKKAKAFFAARRPLEGSKSFLKKRFFEDVLAGMQAGLEPASWNPEELMLKAEDNARRYVMVQEMIRDAKAIGSAKELHMSEKVPEGFRAPNQNWAQLYLNPNIEIKEAFDKKVMEGLETIAKDLGIHLERKPRIGGPALGYSTSSPGRAGKVSTRFATPESVLAHEIGHQIDDLYGLRERFIRQSTLAEKKELRALADLRIEDLQAAPDYFKKYVRKGPEKMAVMLEALIHAPEEFKRVAPINYKKFRAFLKSKPELAPLLKVRPSLVLDERTGTVSAGGIVLGKRIYFEENLARLLDNHMSRDLIMETRLGRGVMLSRNILNSINLGISAFHATGITLLAVMSRAGVGISEVASGNVLTGLGKVATAPVAPIGYVRFGWRFYKGAPELAAFEERLFTAGASLETKQYYRNQAFDNFFKNAKQVFAEGNTPYRRVGHATKAMAQAPFMVLESTMRALQNYYIPQMKVGAFRDLEASQLRIRAKDIAAGKDTVENVGRIAWRDVEDRMGLINYDNEFWDQTLKTSIMVLIRAPGWSLGTVRALGGAAFADLPRYAKRTAGQGFGGKAPEWTSRMSFALAMIVTTMAAGGIYHFLHTGKWPVTLEDYLHPKNGLKNKDGSDQRINFPTFMRDVEGWSRDPIKEAVGRVDEGRGASSLGHGGKLAPEVTLALDLLENQSYRGPIRNVNDPWYAQSGQTIRYIFGKEQPFSISQARKIVAEGGNPAQVGEQFFGMTPYYPPRERRQRFRYREPQQ